MNSDDLESHFYREVLMAGQDSVLPVNLSDAWLDVLLIQAQALHDQKDRPQFSELLAAVLKILFHRCATNELTLNESQLFKYLDLYSIELSMEKINRTTRIKTTAATMETILTDRNIEMTSPISEI